MLRRFFALVLALAFWSIQTADAFERHVDADSAIVAMAGEDVAQPAIDAPDGATKTGEKAGWPSCDSNCACHILHHAFLGDAASNGSLSEADQSYAFGQDRRPDFLSAPLNRPPLA